MLGSIALAALFAISGSALLAQDIAGDWQGTIRGGAPVRTILKISKAEKTGWNATLYADFWGGVAPVTSITFQGSTLKLAVDSKGASYEGQLSADGNSIKGVWKVAGGVALHRLDFDRATKETAWEIPASPHDSSPHTVQFITVDNNVKLEVLDWGGTGRPLVFLAGLGGTAHVFDNFAPKFTATNHVNGITRRGFGDSSAPPPANGNYSADRMGDDVLAVIDALKLNRPVLVGHSIAGEELSSIGSRYPEKVAGLIYLDAGYPYAFYDASRGDFQIDLLDLRRKLDQMVPGSGQPGDIGALTQELLDTDLPRFEKDLRERQKQAQPKPGEPPRKQVEISAKILSDYVGIYQLTPNLAIAITVENGELRLQGSGQPRLPMFAESETKFFLKAANIEVDFARDPATNAVTQLTLHQGGQTLVGKKDPDEWVDPDAAGVAQSPQAQIGAAIMAGEEKYTKIDCPVLAIFAVPHDMGQAAGDAASRAAADAADLAQTGAQADAFAAAIPSAHVVRLAHANHFVFRSNEADVLREMNAFLATLP
jgi:pimeloyl-ACP methyl ester carboxylesterase